MKRLLPVVLLLMLGLAGLGANAQTPRQVTPTPSPTATPDLDVFQDVVVGGWSFSVDPFFPCVVYVTARTSKLDPELGVATVITLQPFYRSGETMLAGDAYVTVDSEITAAVGVGQTFTCQPQVEATP